MTKTTPAAATPATDTVARASQAHLRLTALDVAGMNPANMNLLEYNIQQAIAKESAKLGDLFEAWRAGAGHPCVPVTSQWGEDLKEYSQARKDIQTRLDRLRSNLEILKATQALLRAEAQAQLVWSDRYTPE